MSPISPEILMRFKRNISALEGVDIALADQLSSLDWAKGLEQRRADDGVPSFFSESESLSKSGWFAGSSVPGIREKTLCGQLTKDTSNLLFPGIGHGVGVKYLLEQLTSRQAIFVWESNPRSIAISFALHDFYDAIASRRLVFLVGDDVEKALVDFFACNDSFVLPTQILSWPWLSSRQMAELSHVVEKSANEISGRIKQKIEAMQDQLRDDYIKNTACANVKAESLCVRLTSFSGDISADQLASDINFALKKMSVNSDVYSFDNPADVGSVKLLDRLLFDKPTALISIGLPKSRWPVIIPDQIKFISFLTPPAERLNESIRNSLTEPASNEIYVVGSSEDFEFLSQRFGDERIVLASMAIDCDVFSPAIVKGDFQIGFLADKPISEPEKLGINLDSHKKFWYELTAMVEAESLSYTHANSSEFIQKASRKADVHFGDPKLIEQFTILLEKYLAPAVTAKKLAEKLLSSDLKIRIFGDGWDDLPQFANVSQPLAIDPKKRCDQLSDCEFLLCADNETNWRKIIFEGLASGKTVIVKKLPNDKLASLGELQSLIRELNPKGDFISQIKNCISGSGITQESSARAHDFLQTEYSYTNLMKRLFKL